MATKDKTNLYPILIFVINALIVGPIGYVFKTQQDEHREYKQAVTDKLDELDQQIEEIIKTQYENFIDKDEYHGDQEQILGQLKTLEQRIYEFSNQIRPRSG